MAPVVESSPLLFCKIIVSSHPDDPVSVATMIWIEAMMAIATLMMMMMMMVMMMMMMMMDDQHDVDEDIAHLFSHC